jgi:hypothetical protein
VGGLVTVLLIAAGCGGEPTAATPGGAIMPPTIGAGGRSSSPGAIVGSWQRTTILQLAGDLQRTTTTWRFDADGSCAETVATLDLIEDIPRSETHPCTWRPDVTDVAITFAGATAEVRFSVAFDGFSPDRLLLDGLLFDRVA